MMDKSVKKNINNNSNRTYQTWTEKRDRKKKVYTRYGHTKES